MNKTHIALAILASIITGTTHPLDLQHTKRGIKNKGKHLIQCLKGKETCTKTDFAILGASLLFMHSSFHAALKVGRSVYKPETENLGDKIRRGKREGTVGHCSRKLNRFLRWIDPGQLPETTIRRIRKKSARVANNESENQFR